MKPNVMLSYSRQQTPFVDAFYKDLVKAGYDVWLDYQRLVPSAPWFDQISAGVKNADAVLLIVSKDSIASKNVEDEWAMALKDGKRVILIVFEATPIPNEKLKSCEWVDFRADYKKGLKELDALLSGDLPKEQRSAVPESGFKASFMFWLTWSISLFVALASISLAWTVFIPIILVPLPMRIFRRNYNFSQVAPTLFLMPVFFIFSTVILRGEGNIFYLLPSFVFTLGGIASALGWVLLGLLLTASMRLRARPEAVPARVVNFNKVGEVKQTSVKFFIDHAPEDERYAYDLRRALEKHGHEYVSDGREAQAVFVLLSVYKNESIYRAGKGLSLFPVVLQKIGRIDGELGKIQWLDFRRGMKNLNKIAKLLPEPERLVKVLAVPPTGRQEVFPLVINVLQYFYIITGILAGGGLLTTTLSLIRLQVLGDLQESSFFHILTGILNGVLLLGVVLYSLRALRTRTGGLAALYPLIVLTLFQAVIHMTTFMVFGTGLQTGSLSALTDKIMDASDTTTFSLLCFVVGLVILLPFLVFGWRDFYRWLPMGEPKELGRLENALLLYSPNKSWKLIFHALFHSSFVFFFVAEIFFLDKERPEVSALACVVIPVTVMALFFRWVATRKPKRSASSTKG